MTLNRPVPLMLAGAVAFAAALGLGLYGMGGLSGNAQAQGCAAAAPLAATLKPLARGEVAAVQVAAEPKPATELSFLKPDGSPVKLSDFKGRTVLVNLWATWCAPCRHEMPALDTLQRTLGGPAFEVVAINIDTRDPERATRFLQDTGVTALADYRDPKAVVFQDLKRAGKAFGMPTTLLVDAAGCELASLAGPAEWASADALALIRAAITR
jgi:thiol-disulfide isomerase/thioredoxin